jgi:hypothetical protein
MLDYPVVLSISIVVVVLIAVVLLITVGLVPAITVFCVAGLVFYLLHIFGKFDVTMQDGRLAFDFHENAPLGHSEKEEKTPHIKEVFHIIGNLYTYDEAPAVCAANNAELASFDQLTEAFSLGAEWCSYGWSAGGMALYPTQSDTWTKLQAESQESKRTACGHPGVNGGYFDPKLKFGVNCYGVKPKNHGMKFPQPVPTQDPGFHSMVDKFKKMLPMNLSGFNRFIWSEKSIPGEVQKNISNTADELYNSL